ncbi:InlB B-repeat-containing protein [Ancylomarina sp. YFZ004]
MKRVYLLCVLLFFALQSFSQKEILVGEGKYKAEQNVEEYISGKRKLLDASSYKGKNYVLLQFRGIPTEVEKKRLKAKGIELNSYVQNNTYYAQIKKGELADQLSSTSIISIHEINALSKTSKGVLEGNIPAHAKVNDVIAKVNVIYFDGAQVADIKNFLQSHNMRLNHIAEEFNVITIDMPIKSVKKLAVQPWVKWIEYIALPETIDNIQGRTMNRNTILSENGLGGRNLTGKGISVGVWDGSVQQHPDLGNRLNAMEYERPSEHGMHVSGTVAGAGIIDPKAKGMAPEATLYTYNFGGPQSNKMTSQQEMLYAAKNFDIDVTQNSYGISLRGNCDYLAKYSASDAQLDQIVNQFYPTLTHVFSAGNNQSDCPPSHYSTSTKRSKNVILVGALDEATEMSYFSSWGPMDDGRLLPHICSFGVDTYSSVYNNEYGFMSGTSMATPAVSGTLALLYQRYNELKGEKPLASLVKAAVCNTAEDKGNPGPDYSYGYGIINALKAVKTFEKNQFAIGSVENGEDFTFTIPVPTNAIDLKVMLVWSDYYGTVSTTKALVNDLDLTVLKNGKETKPWILDANDPTKEAVRGIDNLNNAEQVTINKPEAGDYTIKVSGTEVPKGPQQFSVVFYYNTQDLMMVYPNGDEKFAPGDDVAIRWESSGYTGTQTIEFSGDNGVSFKSIANNVPNGTQDLVVTIPDVTTSKGLLRVVQDGTMDVCNAAFSIAAVPTDLKVTAPDCGTDGWSLSWVPVEGADKYQILKADVNQGIYTKIGESATPNFDLPSLTEERNIFSVASVFGETVSERSYALIVNPSLPLDLTAAKLPFNESFEHYPSDFVRVNNQTGTNFGYTPTVFTYEQAHCLYMAGSEDTEDWDATGDVFENNPEDVISAKICQLNTAGISGELWMRTAAQMFNSGEETNANFRVLVDGNPLTNTLGKSVINTIESGEYIMYWNLSDYAGKSFPLEFQAALRNPKDSIQLGHIKIYQPKYDISLSALASSEKATTLSASNDVTVKVKNNSGQAISNIPVSYSINGGAPVYEVIAGPIAPFTRIEYTFTKKADFSTSDRAYAIVATAALAGDKDDTNNTSEFSTANLGDYFFMPDTKSVSNTKKVTSDILKFTDDGAKVLDYSNSFSGSVTFKPTTSGSKVKIKFIDLDLEDSYDNLDILDGNSFRSSPVIATLTGNPDTSDLEYTATNDDGEMTIVFTSDSKNSKSGWYAEVTEVDASEVVTNNILTLSNITKYNGYYPEATSLKINVKNNSATDVEEVLVQYKIDDNEWLAEENMGAIPAGTEGSHTFLVLANLLPVGARHDISARVVNVDDNMDDNLITRTIINDNYCLSYSAASYSAGFFFLTNVSKGDVSNPTSTTEQSNSGPGYYRSTVFPLYNDITTQSIEVEVNGHVDGGKIAVWIDWNDDADYSNDGDACSVVTSDGVQTYAIPITIPEGATLGQKYMRVRATTADVLDPCSSEYSNNGEVEDYMINLIPAYPITIDLSVTETGLNSGVGLSTTEVVTATISNNSTQAISGFDVAYKIDGGAEVKETVADEIAAFSTFEYTFTTTADLSVQGSHSVEIYSLAEGDMDPENDKLNKTINTSVIAVDGFYALNFDGVDDLVDAGTLNDVNIQDFTYEAWINPQSYGGYGGPIGFGRLFQGKAATIFLHGETNTNYPSHCLVVSLGGGAVYTMLNSVELNKWQHVAVSFNSTSKEVKVYIDGVEEITVVKSVPGEIADNSDSHLYIGNNASLQRAFKGMMDEVRVWSDVRSVDEVKSGLYNHVATDAAGLLAQFSFDEGFYNSGVYSGDISASIQNAEVTDVDGSIWAEPSQLLHEIKFKDQVCELTDLGGNHFETEVPKATDLATIITEYKLTYPNVSVTINGVEQTSGITENDYSNSKVSPLQIDFKAIMFGKALSETYKYSIKSELGAECELETFSFVQAANSLLITDLIASPVQQTMTFDVDAALEVTSLKPTFTISAGARAFVNGTEITSETTSLDFTEPIVITVKAANGRASNNYSVALRKSQTINWTVVTDKVYGDLDFNLGATATSGLDVSFASSNTDVLLVAGGATHIVGAGNATITATQIGNNNVLTATAIEKIFTVNKAELTATADDKSVDYTLSIPELTVSYKGWVNDEMVDVLDEQPVLSTIAVQNSLPNDYAITLTGGLDNNYDLTLGDGTLTINDIAAYDVTFNVTEGSNAIEGANIQINNQNLTSAANGELVVKLINGTYNYVVTKAGFADYSGILIVADANITENVVLTLPLPVYTLSYTTDGNGIIIGDNSQEVEQGSDATEIITTANAGYHFVQWTDGVKTETRTDVNVQSDISVEAQFEINTYTLTYHAGTNGSLTGETAQSLNHGETGTEVEAVPEDGYLFVQWSDGVKDNPRTDVGVTMSLNLTAEYTKVYGLPYTQSFDETTLPVDWLNLSNNTTSDVWEFKTKTTGLKGSTGNFAILDSDDYGSGDGQDADLISPIFDLSTYTGVNLKFTHYFREYSSSAATLSYRIGEGDWVQIETWTGASTDNPATFDQTIAEVAGQSNVRFKWNYKGSFAYYWCVDDIEISGVDPNASFTLNYVAGANGSLSGVTTQTVKVGESGTAVEATPSVGYAFIQWSDGVKDNPRTDVNASKDITVTAEFSRVYTLPYTQRFDATTMPVDWQNVSNNGGIEVWEFKTKSSGLSGTTGNFAILDSDEYGSGDGQDADLISPVFDLSECSTVNLKFAHYFKKYSSSAATLSYSVNGADWIVIETWTGANTDNPATFDQEIAAVAGKSNVRFKWNYVGSYAYYWCVDDIELTGTAPSSNYTVVYEAGSNGELTGDLNQTVDHAADGTAVTAVANSGYLFSQWSDGKTDNPRTDVNVTANISVTAMFTRDCTPITSLPYLEDFNASTSMPSCWSNPATEKGYVWEYGTFEYYSSAKTIGTTGNNAYFNSSANYHKTSQTADLISPKFDLSGYSTVYLSFTHLFKNDDDASAYAEVSYSIDGETTWESVNKWDTTLSEAEAFNQLIDGVAGQSNVKFKFTYQGKWDFGWIIDDIKLDETAPIDQYSLTYVAGANGTLIGNLTQTVEKGSDATAVIAVADTGYHFSQWSDGSTVNPRIDESVNADITVSAEFVIDETSEYTLTYTAGVNGSLEGTLVQTVEKGSDATAVSAVADAGYHFTKWSDGSIINPRTDVDVQSDMTVTAEFEKDAVVVIQYMLLYTAGPNGFLEGNVDGGIVLEVNKGEDGPSVLAVADAGYHFSKWEDGRTDNPRIDKAVSDDIFVGAEFEKDAVVLYTLTYIAGANGTLEGSTPQTVEEGSDATAVKAIADAGYHFTQWSDGNTVNPRTDIDVQSDITVTAEFVIDPTPEYTLTYVAGANGSLTGTLVQTVKEGSDATAVKAIADAGYHFTKWSDGSIVNPRTDLNVQLDMTVTAEFVIDPTPEYTLTYVAGANGSLTGTLVQTVEEGSDATAVKAIADAGYHFTKWSDGSIVNPRTDLNVQLDMTVTAEFVIDPTPEYTLTYVAGANGSLTGTLAQTVEEGSDATAVKAIADAGYHFTQWSDGVKANPRTDENVQLDITVEAQFEKDALPQFTLTYTAGENGILTGSTSQTVEKGSDATAVTAVADAGYHFTQWSDGTIVNPRTDIDVQSDMTIEAQFAANVYNLKFVVSSTENFLSGVIIDINDQELTTNTLGEAEIKLEDGTYDYSILIDGYSVFSSSLTISGEDMLETVTIATTGIDEVSIEEIRVYPNPVIDQLILEKTQNVKSISVRSINGRTIDIINPNGSDKVYYNTSNLSSGMYLFCIEYADGKRIVRKVIKK